MERIRVSFERVRVQRGEVGVLADGERTAVPFLEGGVGAGP